MLGKCLASAMDILSRRIPIISLGDAMREGSTVLGMHRDLTPEQNGDQALVDQTRADLLEQLDLALDTRYADYRVRTTHFNEFMFEREGKVVCRHEIECLIVHRPAR